MCEGACVKGDSYEYAERRMQIGDEMQSFAMRCDAMQSYAMRCEKR